MARRRFSESELDELARNHIRYEVAMLVAQACEFHRRYPNGMPASGGFESPVVDDALLEATLIHLRLLDDFLRSKGDSRSLRADDWVPQSDWKPMNGWLSPEIRERINWQVAHLSRHRASWFDWDIRDYGYRCCQQLGSFFGAVKKHRPDRLTAFAAAERCIADGLKYLRPEAKRRV